MFGAGWTHPAPGFWFITTMKPNVINVNGRILRIHLGILTLLRTQVWTTGL